MQRLQQGFNFDSRIIIIIIIIETFVMRLLQLKNEHKRYICYIKIDKKIKTTVARPNEQNVIRPPFDRATTTRRLYVTSGLLHCGLNK